MTGIIIVAILAMEYARGDRVAGAVEYRFVPADTQCAGGETYFAILSSREIAERVQAWFRDEAFVELIARRAGITFSGSLAILPPVVAVQVHPDTVRVTFKVDTQEEARAFFTHAEEEIRRRKQEYDERGVKIEASAPTISKGKRVRLTVAAGAVLFGILGGAIVVIGPRLRSE